MALLKLEKKQWHDFFDRMSKALIGKRAEIEVASLPIGVQIAAKQLPLIGVVYQGLLGLASMEIIGSDDTRHIVQLRDPLMLPDKSESHQ
jgi:hypothetical protein